MRSEREMYQLILGYAQQDPRVRGVILNGSRANPTAKLDQFRDYDIVYLVTDVAPFKEGDISPAFGEVLVMQRTDENQLFHEHFPRLAIYLMQFADGNRIDLTIAPVEDYRPYCFDDKLSVVLLDKDGFLPHLPPPDESTHAVERPSAQVFQECRNEFWWTAPYMSKGLWRGQLPYAQHILEECTRPMLRLMLSWLAGSQKGFPVFPGKRGGTWRTCCPRACGSGTWPPTPPAAACPCGTPCGRPVCCSPRPAATPPRPWGTPGRTTGTSPCPCLWRRHKRTSPPWPRRKAGTGSFCGR